MERAQKDNSCVAKLLLHSKGDICSYLHFYALILLGADSHLLLPVNRSSDWT